MSFYIGFATAALFASITESSITTNDNGYYIGVYDDTNTYNWFEATRYCMDHYDSTLATIYSSTDQTNAANARLNTDVASWIGCNDIASEGSWVWTSVDGSSMSSYTYWNTDEPNDSGSNEDCGSILPASYSNKWNDYPCALALSNFVCDKEMNWRPIYKIINGLSDYGDTSNVYEYWYNGTNNYDTYEDDIDFILNSGFNERSINDSSNYRSLIIDDWNALVNGGAFTTVKLSLYKDDSLAAFMVFDTTNSNKLGWFNESTYVYGSYRDLHQGETYGTWAISGDGGGKRFWEIWGSAGGCQYAYGWVVVTQGTSCTNWEPAEGNTIPQIRYSITENSDAGYDYTLMTDNSTVKIADTLVISVQVDNTTIFGREFWKYSSNNNYISVVFPYETKNWFESKDYCMKHFGSSLASIHSYSQEIEVYGSVWTRYGDFKFWIGLNDILTNSANGDQSEAGDWVWSDGTSYDYVPSWESGEPNGGTAEQCVEVYTTYVLNDWACSNELNEFICNAPVNWRPVFKISDGSYDSIGASSLYDLFKYGTSTYNTYEDDINYIRNTFDASEIESDNNNYRSLVIDDWSEFVDMDEFDKVKISIYSNGNEARYYVFDATSDNTEWFSNNSMIDSSYKDLRYPISLENNYFGFDDQSSNGFLSMLSNNSNDLSNCSQTGWLTVNENGIIFSSNSDSYGILYSGVLSTCASGTQGITGDTLVISVNAANDTTLQIPSKEPTYNPTTNPTDPSVSPSAVPTLYPSRNPTDNPSKNPSSEPTNAPTDKPSNMPTDPPTPAPTDPTLAPSVEPTKSPANPTESPSQAPTSSSSGSGNDSQTTSNSESGLSDSDWLLILIIVGSAFLLTCICCALLLLYSHKHNRKHVKKEIHEAIHSMNSLHSVSGGNNSTNDYQNLGASSPTATNGIQSTNGLMFNSNSGAAVGEAGGSGHGGSNNLKTASLVQDDSIKRNNNGDNNDNNDELEMADMATTIALAQPVPQAKVINTNDLEMGRNGNAGEDDSDDDDERMYASSAAPGGHGGNARNGNDDEDIAFALAMDVAGNKGSGEGKGGNNNDGNNNNETGMIMNINGKKLELHQNWDEWTEDDVCKWLSMEIKNGGFNDDIVNSFITEFRELHLQGRLLKMFLDQAHGDELVLLKKFHAKMKFAHKSLVWDIVVQAMLNL